MLTSGATPVPHVPHLCHMCLTCATCASPVPHLCHMCLTCATCASRKTPSPRQRAELYPVKAEYQMQIVITDILGPLPITPNGNSYLLAASDYFMC